MDWFIISAALFASPLVSLYSFRIAVSSDSGDAYQAFAPNCDTLYRIHAPQLSAIFAASEKWAKAAAASGLIAADFFARGAGVGFFVCGAS